MPQSRRSRAGQPLCVRSSDPDIGPETWIQTPARIIVLNKRENIYIQRMADRQTRCNTCLGKSAVNGDPRSSIAVVCPGDGRLLLLCGLGCSRAQSIAGNGGLDGDVKLGTAQHHRHVLLRLQRSLSCLLLLLCLGLGCIRLSHERLHLRPNRYTCTSSQIVYSISLQNTWNHSIKS